MAGRGCLLVCSYLHTPQLRFRIDIHIPKFPNIPAFTLSLHHLPPFFSPCICVYTLLKGGCIPAHSKKSTSQERGATITVAPPQVLREPRAPDRYQGTFETRCYTSTRARTRLRTMATSAPPGTPSLTSEQLEFVCRPVIEENQEPLRLGLLFGITFFFHVYLPLFKNFISVPYLRKCLLILAMIAPVAKVYDPFVFTINTRSGQLPEWTDKLGPIGGV